MRVRYSQRAGDGGSPEIPLIPTSSLSVKLNGPSQLGLTGCYSAPVTKTERSPFPLHEAAVVKLLRIRVVPRKENLPFLPENPAVNKTAGVSREKRLFYFLKS